MSKALDDAPAQIKDFELLNLKQPNEYGLLYNPTTKKADFHTSNLPERIFWPKKWFGELRFNNKIVTHNHPKGLGLSYSDLRFFVDNSLKEMRAVTESGVYSIKWKKKPGALTLRKLNDQIKTMEEGFKQALKGLDEAEAIKQQFETFYKLLEDKIEYIHYIN